MPLRELIFEFKIPLKEIGNRSIGYRVDLKFNTGDYSTYGSVQGEVGYISETTFFEANCERYHRGRVRLSKDSVGVTGVTIGAMTCSNYIGPEIRGRRGYLASILKFL